MPYSLSDRVLLGLLAVEDRELRRVVVCHCADRIRPRRFLPRGRLRSSGSSCLCRLDWSLLALPAGAAGFILSKWLGIPEAGSLRPSQICPSNSEIEILALTLLHCAPRDPYCTSRKSRLSCLCLDHLPVSSRSAPVSLSRSPMRTKPEV